MRSVKSKSLSCPVPGSNIGGATKRFWASRFRRLVGECCEHTNVEIFEAAGAICDLPAQCGCGDSGVGASRLDSKPYSNGG